MKNTAASTVTSSLVRIAGYGEMYSLILNTGGRSTVRLVADANVLLAAVLGGHPQIQEILTVEQAIAEVQQYAVDLARKKGLAEDLVLLAVGALPVTII